MCAKHHRLYVAGSALKSIESCSGRLLLTGTVPVLSSLALYFSWVYYICYKLSSRPSPYSKVWSWILDYGFSAISTEWTRWLRSLHSTWFKHQHPSAQHLASLYRFYPCNWQFLLDLVTFFLSFFLSFHIFSLVLEQKLMKNSQISGPPLSALHPPLGYADKFQPLFQPGNPTLPPQFSNTASPAWVPFLHPRSQNFPLTESEGECRAPFFPLNCGVTVLYCLLSNIKKQFPDIFYPVLWLFMVAGTPSWLEADSFPTLIYPSPLPLLVTINLFSMSVGLFLFCM